MKKIFPLCLILSAINITGFPQNSSISGFITEKETKDTIICALVILKQDNTQVARTATDMHGKYAFKGIEVGIYTIEVSYLGFQIFIMKDIKVEAEGNKKLDFHMVEKDKGNLPYGGFDGPLRPRWIDMPTTTGETIKAEQIMRIPTAR